MKKSEIYRNAQKAVLRDEYTDDDVKLAVLRELSIQEDLAKFAEEQEADKA